MSTVLPTGNDFISGHVVLKRKLDEKRRIDRYKVLFVAKSSVEKDAVDYHETFAPVITCHVLLLIVGKFTKLGWHVHDADISTAFPYEDIVGNLYILWQNKRFRLPKIMYGLMQLLLFWHEKLKNNLRKFQ